MLQLRRLRGHRRRPPRIAVAQGVDADAAAEIDVFLSLHIHRRGALAAFQRHGEPSIGGHQRPVVERLNIFQGHVSQILSAGFVRRLIKTWCRCPRR